MSSIAGACLQQVKQCCDECTHINYRTRNLLQKEFATSIIISKFEYFICGNGPYILAGRHDFVGTELQVPYYITEIAVFPQLQVTVRGIIPMTDEKYILAFGANYLAMIELEQLRDGGHLCQRRIVSTRGIIVGGRRLGMKKVQVFYENGGFETLEVAKKRKNVGVAQKVAEKLNIQGAKVTSLVVSGRNVLLGTSRGQVFSHAGKIFLKGDESKGTVRQMTVINEHIVLLLFKNKSLALLDLRYHALRSVIEGRFTAIESVFSKQSIVAGDLDGTLHCFNISPTGTQMRLVNSSKRVYRDAILCLVPSHSVLVCTTAMGSLFFVNRAGFVDSAVDLYRGVDFGSQFARATKDKWYFLKDKRLYHAEGTLSSRPQARLEYPNLEFTQLKHYRHNTFHMIYAFGGGNFFSHVTFEKKHRTCLLTSEERVTTAVAADELLLIQKGREITIYSLQKGGWKATVKANLESDSKVSAFATIAADHKSTVFVIACQDGRMYAFKIASSSASPQVMPLSLFTTFDKDFAVSMQLFSQRIHVLTAKAKLHIYLVHCDCISPSPNTHPPHNRILYLENSMSYKYALGRGYEIMIIGRDIYLIGFKQKILNVYKVNERQILSLETRGPRSSYAMYDASSSSFRVICDMGVGVMSRRFPKSGRTHLAEMDHAGSITHILNMDEFPETIVGVFADIVTGDCNGLVALMGIATFPTGTLIFTRMTCQVKGAITCMIRSANYLFVGTSTGALAVFQYEYRALFPVVDLQYPDVITNIQCKPEGFAEGVFIFLANGWKDSIVCLGDRLEAYGIKADEELLEDIKWSWLEVAKEGTLLSLSKDGILYTSVVPEKSFLNHRCILKSTDLPTAERYSYFKNIDIVEQGVLTGLVVGYYDGRFLFAVYWNRRREWKYFTTDRIHRHEIIDCIFYQTPSDSDCIWSLATLDNTGVYVQRTLICDFKGIRLHGLPMKWHCPVRHPKAMALLETKEEVVVVGSGLATLYLNSLAPPPPAK